MIAALVYLQVCSARNRLLAQLGRLRKPQYLLGAVIGFAYLGFFFLRPFASASPGTGGPAAIPPDWQPVAEMAVAFAFFALVAITWIVPSKRATLDFTEAEVAFLFPAPLARRTLIHFRLLKTQLALAFSALIMTFFTWRLMPPGGAWRLALGWWVLMGAMELHRLGAGFFRTRLLDRGVGNWVRRGLGLGLLALLGLTVWRRADAAFAALPADALAQPRALAEFAQTVFGQPPMSWVLWPLRLLVRPLLAPGLAGFALALLPALGLFALLYVWVLVTAVAFEETALERAEQRSRLIAAARAGNWHLAGPRTREGWAPFRLPASGPRPVALMWKNLISAQSVLTSRLGILLLAMLVPMAIGVGIASPKAAGLKVMGAMAVGLAPMLVLVGPDLARFDLRQDLPMADVIKTYPLRGWQLVLGEILAPVFILTLSQCVLVAVAAALFPSLQLPFGARSAGVAPQAVVALSAVILSPVLNLTLLLLHNATAVLFPAWVRLGPQGAQGFEAMGQRMLLMMGHLLSLMLALLPPAGVGTVVFLLAKFAVGWLVALPLAALAAALVLGLEAGLGLKWLGDRFERMDITD